MFTVVLRTLRSTSLFSISQETLSDLKGRWAVDRETAGGAGYLFVCVCMCVHEPQNLILWLNFFRYSTSSYEWIMFLQFTYVEFWLLLGMHNISVAISLIWYIYIFFIHIIISIGLIRMILEANNIMSITKICIIVIVTISILCIPIIYYSSVAALWNTYWFIAICDLIILSQKSQWGICGVACSKKKLVLCFVLFFWRNKVSAFYTINVNSFIYCKN